MRWEFYIFFNNFVSIQKSNLIKNVISNKFVLSEESNIKKALINCLKDKKAI